MESGLRKRLGDVRERGSLFEEQRTGSFYGREVLERRERRHREETERREERYHVGAPGAQHGNSCLS